MIRGVNFNPGYYPRKSLDFPWRWQWGEAEKFWNYSEFFTLVQWLSRLCQVERVGSQFQCKIIIWKWIKSQQEWFFSGGEKAWKLRMFSINLSLFTRVREYLVLVVVVVGGGSRRKCRIEERVFSCSEEYYPVKSKTLPRHWEYCEWGLTKCCKH